LCQVLIPSAIQRLFCELIDYIQDPQFPSVGTRILHEIVRPDMVGMLRFYRPLQSLAPPALTPFDRNRQPVFLPEPLDLLVIDDNPLTPERLIRLAAAFPRMLAGDFVLSLSIISESSLSRAS
jgi:hypothetical protein